MTLYRKAGWLSCVFVVGAVTFSQANSSGLVGQKSDLINKKGQSAENVDRLERFQLLYFAKGLPAVADLEIAGLHPTAYVDSKTVVVDLINYRGSSRVDFAGLTQQGVVASEKK